jgi:hypothetical protein
MKYFLFFLGLLFFISGCANVPPAKPTGLKPQDFWREQSLRSGEVSHLTAKLLLEYQGRKESASGQARVIAQLPNHFRLELRDPLGRVRYVVALADKQFIAYYPTLHKAYLDETGGRSYLKNLIGTDISFAELQGLALGLIPKSLSVDDIKSWEWDGGRGQYVGNYQSSERAVTVFVDPVRAVLKGLWIKSTEAGLTKFEFSEFAGCCGAVGRIGKGARSISLAHAVALTQDQSHSTLDIEWRELESLDKPKPESIFRETLPEGVEQIRLN